MRQADFERAPPKTTRRDEGFATSEPRSSERLKPMEIGALQPKPPFDGRAPELLLLRAADLAALGHWELLLRASGRHRELQWPLACHCDAVAARAACAARAGAPRLEAAALHYEDRADY